MHKLNLVILFAFILSSPTKVLAWGKLGHESTALIAEKNLGTKALKEIKLLLGTTDLRGPSNWPDVIKAQAIWYHTKPFHFTSVDDGQTYYESLKQMSLSDIKDGDAIRAMIKAEDILRSPKATKSEKVAALSFLVHIISDIHQPLHTGKPADKGGNLIKLDWFGKMTTLHSVWDNGILDFYLSNTLNSEVNHDPATYISQIAAPALKMSQTWLKGNYLEWHNESVVLRSKAYDLVDLDNEDAVKKNKTLIDQRILQSGQRLAWILNSIYDAKPINKEGLTLRENLKKILGLNHLNDILLVPQEVEVIQRHFHNKYECKH